MEYTKKITKDGKYVLVAKPETDPRLINVGRILQNFENNLKNIPEEANSAIEDDLATIRKARELYNKQMKQNEESTNVIDLRYNKSDKAALEEFINFTLRGQ